MRTSFSNVPYLESFAGERNLKLSVLCAVRTLSRWASIQNGKSLTDVPEGAKVAIPNDPTNGGRALKVLENAGLITLKDGVGVKGTPTDVTVNRLKLKIVELEAATLPRALDDVTLAVITPTLRWAWDLIPEGRPHDRSEGFAVRELVVAKCTGDDRLALKKLSAYVRPT